ncbi:MAG: HIT domain-containing protein [Coriobacteriia bacterium]|nr:HIT domain-containing protein [Coriobacteriia bacterium]
MSDCVFCMVANGEIPAHVVYEDEHVVAFDDIAPQGPVHTLIVPRVHYEHLGDSVPAEVLCALAAAAPKVAELKGVAESGYRVIINTGRDAMQTVHHLHAHVIGGKPMAHGMVHFTER